MASEAGRRRGWIGAVLSGIITLLFRRRRYKKGLTAMIAFVEHSIRILEEPVSASEPPVTPYVNGIMTGELMAYRHIKRKIEELF